MALWMTRCRGYISDVVVADPDRMGDGDVAAEAEIVHVADQALAIELRR
jgi:hypothetical protein